MRERHDPQRLAAASDAVTTAERLEQLMADGAIRGFFQTQIDQLTDEIIAAPVGADDVRRHAALRIQALQWLQDQIQSAIQSKPAHLKLLREVKTP